MTQPQPLIIPTISAHGTAAATLIDDYTGAWALLEEAHHALLATGPNLRDYPAERFKVAIEQHVSRVVAVERVIIELRIIVEAIDAAGLARAASTTTTTHPTAQE